MLRNINIEATLVAAIYTFIIIQIAYDLTLMNTLVVVLTTSIYVYFTKRN
jgi:hypothetical protein